MRVSTNIINYLDSLEIPIEIRKDHQMSVVTLKQMIRNWYEKEYGICYEDDKKMIKEMCIMEFLEFLLNNKICTVSASIIYGIGPMSSERMELNFGKPKNPKTNTFFAGRSNRSRG